MTTQLIAKGIDATVKVKRRTEAWWPTDTNTVGESAGSVDEGEYHGDTWVHASEGGVGRD
jgi:hypothetical protein